MLGNCFSSPDFLELHEPGQVGCRLGPLAAAQWQGGGAVGADFVKGEQSFYPPPGSYLIGKAAMKNAVADFNGTKRSQPFDVGAYRFNAKGHPGWKIAPGFKK